MEYFNYFLYAFIEKPTGNDKLTINEHDQEYYYIELYTPDYNFHCMRMTYLIATKVESYDAALKLKRKFSRPCRNPALIEDFNSWKCWVEEYAYMTYRLKQIL